MFEQIAHIYALLFGRPRLQKFNKLLYRLSLSGQGILNYKSSDISGESLFLRSILNECDVVVDVGANIGGYTKGVLAVNDKVNIFSFEPHPITFKTLQQNVAGHSNVKAINKAVSAENGQLQLYDYSAREGSSHASAYKEVITELHNSSLATCYTVETITIDEFMRQEGINFIDLLKIDVEGNEYAVMLGALSAIKQNKIRFIHFEFNEMNVVSRVFFRDIWNLLSNYKLYRLLPKGMHEITAYSPLYCEIFAYQNIVAKLKT